MTAGANAGEPGMLSAPERFETDRLVLRRPAAADVGAIFARYANDPEVTRFLSWPRHEVIDDTRAFIQFSDAEWQRCPAGPYLIEARDRGILLGSTGLGFETSQRASTGYVLARDAWGQGYATEALRAIVVIAASHVLQKCGFTREATMHQHTDFPNLRAGQPSDVFCYARIP
jgi:ribosomal-protein-alanine N-acetyltransferase